jgi:beta-galactosidase
MEPPIRSVLSCSRFVLARILRSGLLMAALSAGCSSNVSGPPAAQGSAAVPIAAAPALALPDNRLDFDADWRFFRGDAPDINQNGLDAPTTPMLLAGIGGDLVLHGDPAVNHGGNISFAKAGFDDKSWRALDLPHDWGIDGAFDSALPGNTGKLPWAGVGWYRKHFRLPAHTEGMRAFLDIDGAMSHADIWINGRYAGQWPYGYASFRVDLTPYLNASGDNVVAIRLNNPDRSSRWYPGGGLYRNVWLETTDPVHVAHWGTYITTPTISATSATVNVEAKTNPPPPPTPRCKPRSSRWTVRAR